MIDINKTNKYANYNVSDILKELTSQQSAATIKVDYSSFSTTSKNNQPNTISNVIFNDPATIVFWADGTKTVVKAQDEAFDPEKGLAMAISKKFFGNEGNYFNRIKKWTEEYVKPKIDVEKELPWRIWIKYLDKDGREIGGGVYFKSYARKSPAVRRAKQLFSDNDNVIWVVRQTNPWIKEIGDEMPQV